MSLRLTLISGIAATLLAAGAIAANSPPFAGAWNITAKGRAQSSGELLFRVTPVDGADTVEVTVAVLSGTNELNVAREIREALGTQLRADRFNVELGEGAQVSVTDAAGQPNFSLQLVQADIENLRVVVSSAAPVANPVTASPQAAPNTNSLPPDAPGAGGAGGAGVRQPGAPPPETTTRPSGGPAPSDSPQAPPPNASPAPNPTPPSPQAPSGSATAPPGS